LQFFGISQKAWVLLPKQDNQKKDVLYRDEPKLKLFHQSKSIIFALGCKINNLVMAIISMFYGIIISMYYLDNKQHNLPHIHVRYQDEEAVISIIDGQLLEGTLKANKMKLVLAWIEIHNDELIADWQLAISGETIFKIDPLK